MASSPSTPTMPPPTTTPAAPSEPQTQPATATTPPVDKYNNTNPLVHTIALGVTPLALLALCLPPRRLDLRATMLGGVALWGTNQLAHDYSGRSFAERFSARMPSLAGPELPEKAKEVQARLRLEKELKAKLRAVREEAVRSGHGPGPIKVEGLTDEEKKILLQVWKTRRLEDVEQETRVREGNERAGEKGVEKGVLEKIWMGDAEPDWKEKRDQKEREALREGGGGYWGLITDQIGEVWSGGKKNEGDSSKERTGDDDARKS